MCFRGKHWCRVFLLHIQIYYCKSDIFSFQQNLLSYSIMICFLEHNLCVFRGWMMFLFCILIIITWIINRKQKCFIILFLSQINIYAKEILLKCNLCVFCAFKPLIKGEPGEYETMCFFILHHIKYPEIWNCIIWAFGRQDQIADLESRLINGKKMLD